MAEQLGWGVANQVLEGVKSGFEDGGVFGTRRRRATTTVDAMPTAGDRPSTRAATGVCCVDFFVEHLEETVFHARLRVEVLTEYVGAHFVGDAQGVQRRTASARRKRAAGHLRQVEKRRHDPHPGVTGQLEYDHPVSYEVAVAKKPQMILNSEEMEQMYETNPKEAAKYVFVSNMPGRAP